MPAGVGWSQYIKFSITAFLSMAAGSQLVHIYYNPLNDLDKYVEEEMQRSKLLLPASSSSPSPITKTTNENMSL